MVQNWNNVDYEILLMLVREPAHLRGLAKSLGQSHTTLLRRINQLLKENVLDYMQKGKNKVFFIKKNIMAKQYVYRAEHYKLSKLITAYPELAIILEDVLKTCKERLMIVFGSYAKFQATKGSDIDVYIETTRRKVKDEAEAVHARLSVKIGRFDPENVLVKEIIKNHVIVRGVEEFYEKTKFFA
jgi:predicted nucleotidyltransferase